MILNELSEQELELKAKRFSMNVINFVSGLTQDKLSALRQRILINSVIEANLQSAIRLRSSIAVHRESKSVGEDVDETLYWLRQMAESHIVQKSEIEPILHEGEELCSIYSGFSGNRE